MLESEHDEPRRGGRAIEVAARVEAQVEAARSGVFHAYLASREKARQLADADRGDPDRRRPRPS
ncbi:MAG TPA: hypothetical protein VNT03_20060 [Baekduia sp.]|nr:hypothetical protein [Baekduia sp.]